MARGVKAKKKKHTDRTAKYLISDKQLEKIKKEVAWEATTKASLLNLTATVDCFGLTEDQVCELAETVTRYAMYVEKHIVRLNEMADLIKEKTGIEFSRF